MKTDFLGFGLILVGTFGLLLFLFGVGMVVSAFSQWRRDRRFDRQFKRPREYDPLRTFRR